MHNEYTENSVEVGDVSLAWKNASPCPTTSIGGDPPLPRFVTTWGSGIEAFQHWLLRHLVTEINKEHLNMKKKYLAKDSHCTVQSLRFAPEPAPGLVMWMYISHWYLHINIHMHLQSGDIIFIMKPDCLIDRREWSFPT